MKRLTDRRKILLAAGTVAVAAVAGTVAAQSTDIRGTVAFEGGGKIPEGQISISLEDAAMEDNARSMTAATGLKSDGGSKAIAFTFALPETLTSSPTQEIVARLERADGWLLARGSAQIEAGAPVDITLFTVMY